MSANEPTLESLSKSLQENRQLVDELSRQLDSALQEISRLKELIVLQNDQQLSPSPNKQKIDIQRLREEIQDSLRTIKHDYEQEMQVSMRANRKQRKFQTVMPAIQESPESQSRTFNDITPPQNQQSKQRSCRQKATVNFGDDLRYDGELLNGQFNGFGIVTRNDQQLYVGSFRQGLFHGQGRLLRNKWLQPTVQLPFEQWVSYSGQFQEGSFDGMGTLVLNANEKYLGRFRRGKIEGEGVHYKCGGIELGRWERNRFCQFL